MAKAYSMDLRVRVLADYDEGTRPVDLVRRYRVSEWWVYKMIRQRRETGCVEPRRGRTGPKPKLAGHGERLRELVGEDPDATLEELRARLGISTGISTLWRALRDLKLTLKKSHSRRGATAA